MIKFKKVRFKNFGSFGNNFTELILDKNPTTLICGNNGSGKSFAFLDSITFALFGKPFRKINIPQLTNSVNNKNCVVEIEFSKGNDEYLIRRGLNPKIFEIFRNSNLINQDAKSLDYQEVLEDQILKMNYKTFTQVVILGSSSFVPFMQLSAADRRAVIENILDINVFSTMNILLKGKIMQLKETIREINNKIEIEKQKSLLQSQFISTLENKSNEDKKALEEKSNNLQIEIQDLQSEIVSVETQIQSMLLSPEEEKKINKSFSDLERLRTKIFINFKNLEKDIEFFETNTSCPSCNQKIDETIKTEEIQKKDKRRKEYEKALNDLDLNIEESSKKIKEVTETNKKIQDLNLQIVQKRTSIKNAEKYRQSLLKELNDMGTSTDQIKEETKKLEQLKEVIALHENEKDEHKDELVYHEHAHTLLKDSGVKAKIIKYYLPYMNKYINKFLSSMDFFAQFTLDEDFNEKIKSRHRDEFSYMNFSEGEKMRIDLALLLAWREIARTKNSVNCNLLILDEVFDSSLDSLGMDELMKLLNAVSDKSNIFVISHKSDQLVDKFQHLIGFEKKNNFSKII
jgi:DNA repair exonuclease SbcCD ATPase subunit